MTTYTLINGATAAFGDQRIVVPATPTGPIPKQAISPSQTFQLNVSGTGTVSATVQLWVSNDGKNWATYMDPLTVTGTSPVTAGWGGTQGWAYFSATLPAITGTGASASLTMNG